MLTDYKISAVLHYYKINEHVCSMSVNLCKITINHWIIYFDVSLAWWFVSISGIKEQQLVKGNKKANGTGLLQGDAIHFSFNKQVPSSGVIMSLCGYSTVSEARMVFV